MVVIGSGLGGLFVRIEEKKRKWKGESNPRVDGKSEEKSEKKGFSSVLSIYAVGQNT